MSGILWPIEAVSALRACQAVLTCLLDTQVLGLDLEYFADHVGSRRDAQCDDQRLGHDVARCVATILDYRCLGIGAGRVGLVQFVRERESLVVEIDATLSQRKDA